MPPVQRIAPLLDRHLILFPLTQNKPLQPETRWFVCNRTIYFSNTGSRQCGTRNRISRNASIRLRLCWIKSGGATRL
jgi:hypothetical protein